MSIIYDALKKAENNIVASGPADKMKTKPMKPKVKPSIIYILVICAGLFIANLAFSFFHRSAATVKKSKLASSPTASAKPAGPKQAKPPVAQEEESTTESSSSAKEIVLTLNGVFFSQNEGYALINNRIVKEGDRVGGATVKKISLEDVELERAGQTIKLTTNKN